MPICGQIQHYKVLLCSGSSAIASTHTFTFTLTDQCLRWATTELFDWHLLYIGYNGHNTPAHQSQAQCTFTHSPLSV